MNRSACTVFTLLACCLSALGCERKTYDPAWATQPYPFDAHTTRNEDIQVFRKDTSIELVNATATSYSDFNLWVNQRYVRKIDQLPAGGRMTLSLWDFKDEYGYAFYAGGFFRTLEPTPVRMVEIQPTDGSMVALITIRSEPVIIRGTSGRN